MTPTKTALEDFTNHIDCGMGDNATYELSQQTIDTIKQALTANIWRDIKDAPDGRSILGITRVMFNDDKFFEPQKCYRNGDFWFHDDGREMLSPPTYFQDLPLPHKPEQPPC